MTRDVFSTIRYSDYIGSANIGHTKQLSTHVHILGYNLTILNNELVLLLFVSNRWEALVDRVVF